MNKMVLKNLLKNSIAAYFAAIEIHNKPNIPYRYESVTLLLINAWELALKAFVRKFVKKRSIFTKEGNTISLSKALDYVDEYINTSNPKGFIAYKKNIELIEVYRNEIIHFYSERLEPYIFMLVSRSAYNFVEFLKIYFSKDIIVEDGLSILPLGFKLPFKPEDFLSKKTSNYTSSLEAKEFIDTIVNIIRDLRDDGVEDSIVLGFDIYLESVKKMSNSDILVAISSQEEADATFVKQITGRISNDPGAQLINLNEHQFREVWKHNHSDLVKWCKKNIVNFKQNRKFNMIKKKLIGNTTWINTRQLDINKKGSPSQSFYSDLALNKIKEMYEEEIE